MFFSLLQSFVFVRQIHTNLLPISYSHSKLLINLMTPHLQEEVMIRYVNGKVDEEEEGGSTQGFLESA